MQEHPPASEQRVGEVTHYWNHLGVAGVHLEEPLDVGDRIHVLGHTTDFTQEVGSMEVEHHKVDHAESGADVGIRVCGYARSHDDVFKIVDAADIGEGQNEL